MQCGSVLCMLAVWSSKQSMMLLVRKSLSLIKEFCCGVLTVSYTHLSTEVNFKREDEEYSKLSAFFTQKRDGAVAEIKGWKSYLGFGIGAAAAIGAFFVGYWLFAVALIGIGYGVGVMISNKSQIKHLEQKCAESIKTTSDILQQLFAEFSKYQACLLYTSRCV